MPPLARRTTGTPEAYAWAACARNSGTSSCCELEGASPRLGSYPCAHSDRGRPKSKDHHNGVTSTSRPHSS
jgi:hypothetical protein